MGVSFEEEFDNLDKKVHRSLNSMSEKKRAASKEARKRFKSFEAPNKKDAFDFLRNYSKTNFNEEDNEEEPKEAKKMRPRSKRKEEEERGRKNGSDSRARKNEYRSTSTKKRRKEEEKEEEEEEEEEEVEEEEEEEEEEESDAKPKLGSKEGKSKESRKEFCHRSEDNFRPANDKRKLKAAYSFDSNKYLDTKRTSGETALEELLQVCDQDVLTKEEVKRESSGWNISDDDMEEYIRAKNQYRAKQPENTSPSTSKLYWGAASLLAAGFTMAVVKSKFFS